MVFGEDKGFAACGQGIAVALFEGLGSFATRHAEVLDRNCQIGAGRQAYKIQGVGSRPGFVEVIHAPNQTALLVAPCTEVFDVQVADSEHGGRLPAKAESSGRKWRERKGRAPPPCGYVSGRRPGERWGAASQASARNRPWL